MRINRMALVTTLALLGGAAVGTVASRAQESVTHTPPAVLDPSVPEIAPDHGVGERLLLVAGGAFPTLESAEKANDRITMGDVQGYYVARVDQFVGLDEALGAAGDDYVLVSAFRTAQGAQEYLQLARAAGAPALVTPRLQNLGYEYVGLGQEADPDGSGPLTHPIPGLTVP
ncbi:MAG: hypothetical protein ACRDH8_07880 [Actinomycetota bacterium]